MTERLLYHPSDVDPVPYEVLAETDDWYWLRRQGDTDPATWAKPGQWRPYEELPYPIGTELEFTSEYDGETPGRYYYLGRFGSGDANPLHALRAQEDGRVYQTPRIDWYRAV